MRTSGVRRYRCIQSLGARTLPLLLAALVAMPGTAGATVSIGAWIQHSPDDLGGFTSLTGDDNTVSVGLPFTFTVEGVNYTTVVLSTNGWLEFGANTSGSADHLNTCLPTANHTNPFLAAYWDDLVPFGTNVRYGTVGTSPARTFIADYEVDLFSPPGAEGSDDLRFQIQLHEGSNLITVRYRDQQSATNGIAATIGYQGPGGAGASSVQPITCNGKVLDDNRPNEGFSVDVGRAGNVVMYALMAHSPDDISGFATLTGDDNQVGVTMPFSVTIEGTSYNQVTVTTNGHLQFGTLAGLNPFTNTALPSASFSGPTLFYFWDDIQPEGGNVRYGTVGTAPNRTFIVDFQENLVGDTGSKVNGQVQVHEGSSLINVKYRNTMSPNANGQTATLGFQGAGGASALAYPLTFNGKVLDDNRPDEGWSVHPRALGAMSLHSTIQFSPDDISGFATLSGDNAIAGINLPFTFTIDGVGYTNLTIGTNGLIQFGTTSGANPTGNVALPSASFTGPTLFWYWDDLQTEGGNIRHGLVGTAPHRTYIVDFQENRVGDTGSKVNGQVQIHEGSNTIGVKYRSTLSVNANGQSATIGFQGAGGAGAYPLTFNGKILDDNLPDAGWSIAPLPICGNALVETKEQCDQGGSNGAGTSCCTSVCGFRSAGQVCRASAGACDVADTCTGSSATCPADGKVASGTPCRASAGVCDVAENCNGVANTCPTDVFQPSSTVCRSSAGVCDVAENCTGSGAACPGDAFQPSSTVCRSSAGICDVAESCTGSGAACPGDAFQPSSTVCRSSAGICDVAESCTGSGAACPGDAFQPSSTVCRSSAGICDVAESCTGSGAACPGDAFQPSSVVCRAGSGDLCDPDEGCTGSGAACPSDVVAPNTTVCNPGSGDLCDPDENCTGTAGQACPSDTVAPNTTLCRAGSGDLCDPDESCTGTANLPCPPDVVAPNTTVCNPGSGDLCDPDESCTGTAGQPCPADIIVPSSTVCRGTAGVCDVAENCTGVADQGCPADSVSGAFVVCRSAAGECDAAENCDGSTVNCPADAKDPANTPCTGDSNVCTLDLCDGVSNLCTHPAGNAGTLCRAAAGVCDVAELCDGSNTSCPADAKAPTSTVCRASGGVCDDAESCDGSNDNCPSDSFLPSSTVCRGSAGICDAAENCTGSGANCPGDGFQPSSTVCRSAAGVCDVAESCTGSGVACPADLFQPATTVCRSAVDSCDIAEQCSGSGAACPADAMEPDSDFDTFCDAIDNCPVTPNPGQEDSDNDTDGDACDLCTNTLPSIADRGKVVIGKLATPPGDDTAKIKGRCIPFQETPTLDPVTNGVRLVMQDDLGNLPLDATIPGGAYSTVTKAGWKVHAFPTGMTAQYKNAGTVVPLVNGIKKLKFVIKSGLGITKFNATGKGGSYPVALGAEPVKVTFIADPPIAETGQCCEMFFPGPPPAPTCTFVGGGGTLRCK